MLLAWPCEGSGWDPVLRYARQTYRQLVRQIRQYQPVVVCVQDSDFVAEDFWTASADDAAALVVSVPFDHTRIADAGPVPMVEEGVPCWAQFAYDGRGGRLFAPHNAELVQNLRRTQLFRGLPVRSHAYVMERGAVESDGCGTIMTSARVWRHRDPAFSRERVERRLHRDLGASRVLWLEHGELLGDDTDGHVDQLARFADPETIVFQGCQYYGDPHYPFLQAMARQLGQFRTASGQRYRLLELPLPRPVGRSAWRLPAGYASFVVLNGAVAVPTYEDPENDERAMEVIAQAFPDRNLFGVDSRVLVTQGGGLHSATIALPAGTLT